jgi:hypothetical protein
VFLKAVIAVRQREASATALAQAAYEAARRADVPLMEGLAFELLGRFDEAANVYQRIGASALIPLLRARGQRKRSTTPA